MLPLAFMLGFAGSLHCAGMCGPLVLALPAASRPSPGLLAYHAGRIACYAVIGALFGLVGRSLALAGFQKTLSVAAGVTLVAAAAARGRGLSSIPVFRFVGLLKGIFKGLLGRRSPGALLALGFINGLLPCGLVYAAATTAAASGGFLRSMECMLAFGLGTLPMLAGLGLGKRLLPPLWIRRGQRLLPALTAGVGALLILRGMSLGIPYLSPALAGVASAGCCR